MSALSEAVAGQEREREREKRFRRSLLEHIDLRMIAKEGRDLGCQKAAEPLRVT